MAPVETPDFAQIPTTTLADVLGKSQVIGIAIRPLWTPVGRVAGPAMTVRCPPGDNLMLHAAIYRAEPGSVIVVDAGGDEEYAVAGGNVCAIAQRHGVAGFVIDGVIRDIAEVRESRFPLFARGTVPIPGVKKVVSPLNEQVRCGGVVVTAGDVVVADEEGIVVVPAARAGDVLVRAQAILAKEAETSLDEWEAAHRARIEEILRDAADPTPERP
jgi:4-hydroxy-4-methyl-2-oxoglutarate aldolase